MIFNKEIFEKLSNEHKFEVEDNVARYLGYTVMLYFQRTNSLSIWLGSDFGFKYADNYNDAVDKIEKMFSLYCQAAVGI